MNGNFHRFQYFRPVFGYTLTVLGLCLSTAAAAQSTPAELADMTLEDLLDFEISEPEQLEGEKPKRWEFAYTYRKLKTDGYQLGTRDLSFQDVLFSQGEIRTGQNYPVVPTFIHQTVNAFSAGYKINDTFSLDVIIPYIEQNTDHISSVPGFSEFILKSKGVGDIGISGSYQKQLTAKSAMQLNLGMRLPVGSINETGDTPRNGSGTLERLPYTMQIGSGTLDFTGAAGYSQQSHNVKWGANINATLRTGENENNYRLGNNFGTALWAQYSKYHWVQPGLKINLRKIQKIKGADTSLLIPNAPFPFPASITDPDNFGGTKSHISALVKICPNAECRLSFSAEYGVPIYQNLNGVQPCDENYFSLTSSVRF